MDADGQYRNSEKFLELLPKACHWINQYPDEQDIMQIAYLRKVMQNAYHDQNIEIEDVLPILREAIDLGVSFGNLIETIKECSSLSQWRETMEKNLE